MAARVIENRRDRFATILVAPLMSCSARLPVYLLLAGAFLGEAAGVLWRHLHASGPTTMTVLLKQVDLPRDALMQAIGWLARENKIDIIEDQRRKRIMLRDNGA